MEPIFSISCRIYWEDTDAGGIVYYANYLKLAERARTEWLRQLGFNQSRMEGGFVVRRCVVDYHAPAKLDDLLTVTAEIMKISSASLQMKQRILLNDLVIADLEIILVYIAASGRAVRIPAQIRDLLS